MTWDGVERRSNMQHLAEVLEDHIKQDDVRLADILDKIHRLDSSINGMTILLTETLKNQMTLMASNQAMTLKHENYLYGENGVAVKLSSFEEMKDNQKFSFRTAIAAMITVAIKTIYDVMRHH